MASLAISIFDLFSIGLGPSSSHTVGPMLAANSFLDELQQLGKLTEISQVNIDLYGSLALTGIGHGTDKAIVMGLQGHTPDSIDPAIIPINMAHLASTKQLTLGHSDTTIGFDLHQHLIMHSDQTLPQHTNGMRFHAHQHDNLILSSTYFSVGGGFIVSEEDFGKTPESTEATPYPFDTAEELFAHCRQHNKTIADIMLANETCWRTHDEIITGLMRIVTIMKNCIKSGLHNQGVLPGGLDVERRAPALYKQLLNNESPNPTHPSAMQWLNVYAMAVNEENAAGHRIVTAPTNGASGIMPAVLQYLCDSQPNMTDQTLADYLLTAGAIAILYKKNASISGAEMGCQGEVGVASSMAAGALAAVLGGSIDQIENAAEIAMEHNLGLTCDPIGGLVQIPCIERNAMGAVKAVNAAGLAMAENGKNKISLDSVIRTMHATGLDMKSIYKETSLGGLAIHGGLNSEHLGVNIPEC
jgi:L-serine dehydratase